MRIEGLSTLVTGGGSGLGLATARHLVSLGASVIVADLPTSPGADEALQLGDRARFMPTDVTDDGEVEAACAAAEEFGPLRVVVHCAGRGGDHQRIVDENRMPGPIDTFADMIRVNLTGSYNVLRLASARMSANDPLDGDRGVIVLTASTAAFEGRAAMSAYVASKAGVHGMTINAAKDLASWQIRVNAIAPGVFDTPMAARIEPGRRRELEASIPHPKRLGEGIDFAKLAVFMVDSSYMNGETVRLDAAFRG